MPAFNKLQVMALPKLYLAVMNGASAAAERMELETGNWFMCRNLGRKLKVFIPDQCTCNRFRRIHYLSQLLAWHKYTRCIAVALNMCCSRLKLILPHHTFNRLIRLATIF